MRFKFYADENFSFLLVRELRRLGHDILTMTEDGKAGQGLSDPQVLELAIALDRSVLTFNRKDFLALHHDREQHCGLLLCKDDRNRPEQAQVLHQYLLKQTTLHDRCLRILKQNQPGTSEARFRVREYLRSDCRSL